jgi:FMN reductase
MTLAATLVIGNPRKGSRTSSVAVALAGALRSALAAEGVPIAEPDVVDLAELGSMLPARASSSAPAPPVIEQALKMVQRPGLLIVVSPTFKGAYPGLLKLFFDALPMRGLSGTVAMAAMTAGWESHRGAADQFLCPLLTELGAAVPVPGLSVIEEEFADLHPVLGTWIKTHGPTLAAVLWRHRDGFERLPGLDEEPESNPDWRKLK